MDKAELVVAVEDDVKSVAEILDRHRSELGKQGAFYDVMIGGLCTAVDHGRMWAERQKAAAQAPAAAAQAAAK